MVHNNKETEETRTTNSSHQDTLERAKKIERVVRQRHWKDSFKERAFLAVYNGTGFLSAIKRALLDEFPQFDLDSRADHAQIVLEAKKITKNPSYPQTLRKHAEIWLDHYENYREWALLPQRLRAQLYVPEQGGWPADYQQTGYPTDTEEHPVK